MYALSTSDEGDCYLCVPPDPGIEAAALGAGETAALGASPSATPGAGESAPSGSASAQVFHTFTLDAGASRSFFRDRTTLTPLSRPVAVSLADPSGGPVLASFSTVLPCPAAPSGPLTGLYLPSFSTNLVSGADLQDQGVDQFTPASQRVTHCTCARTGRHLATFTRQPGSSLYTLSTASPLVASSSQVFAAASGSGPESASCSCRRLSHETLLWHHRLGHPSLPRLRGMASRVLVSGLPRSLPPLPPGPAPTCVSCVEGRQHAAPHSSEFPPTEAPLQTLHMDVWGPARVRGQGHERYFLLVVDDYSRYTTVFPLCSKGEVTEVLIDWIRAARLRLRESFGSDFPVLRLHSDRGGEFSSARLGAFCRAQGIRQTFTLPVSPQQNGIAERRIGMVMDVARTSMIHAAAPHFLWPFAVQYAAHQLNLQPRVSLPETSPTLLWTGKVGDASAFRVWGSRAFVRDLSVDKLSPRATPCVFLGFPPDVPGWQFYHPTSRRVLSSQDVTFDESVPYYRLFPYRTAPLPPPPLFLAPGPPPVDPLPPQGPAPSGVSQVDAVEPVEVAVDSGAATGAAPAGTGSGGAEPLGAGSEGAEPGGATSEGAEPGGAEPGGAESAGTEPGGAASEGAKLGGAEPGGAQPGGAGSARVVSRGTSSRRELLSPQELREWFARRWSRATGAGGTTAAAGSGGARPGGAGAAGSGGAAEATGVGPAGGSGGTGAADSAGTGASEAAGAAASGGVGAGGSTGTGPSEGAGVGAAGAGASESAAPGAGESVLSGTAPTEALHTFTLDSGASRSFFCDSTTLTPLSQPVVVSLADPSWGLVLAHSSTVLPCPAAPSGLLSGLHLPSFSTNLVSGADLQDAWCFLPRPGLVQRRPPARVVPCHTRLSFGTTALVTPPCLVFEVWPPRAAPHSSEFPPTEAPLQTLHMDVWGPARVRGQGHERYFLLVVDDYSRYTTVFPLRSKGEGRPIQFDMWLDNLQLYLLSDSRDSVSLFDHTSGAAPAPPATADSATRSLWLTHDAAARLAICNHLPLAKCAHFGQHRTAQALYDAVVARYSSPAIAALGRLLLPYLFPELSAFATVKDLVSHLRASNARYTIAAPAEFLDRNQTPMFITLYFIVTRLPYSLRSVRGHFLSLYPTFLTVDLLGAETSVVVVGAARGTLRTPFFEGCSPSPLAPSYASAAAVDILGTEDVGAASASAKRRSSKGTGGKGGGGGSGSGGGAAVEVEEAVEVVAAVGVVAGVGALVAVVEAAVGVAVVAAVGVVAVRLELSVEVLEEARGSSSSSIRASPRRPSNFTCGKPHTQHRCFSRLDDAWRAEFGDEVERPHWAELLSAEGDYYQCVPPDPGIDAAAQGASESSLPGTTPTEALHTFTLDSGASRCFFRDSTTLTPLPAPVPVRMTNPSEGPVAARSSTVLPCLAVPSGSLSGLHLPSFSTNLVSASGQVAPPCSCRLLSHQTLLWHYRLGHPSMPRLRGMHSHLLVSGLPRSLPPLPPSPAPPCLPCVEERQRAAPHSSSFPPTTAPLQTLHMDMWGPARVTGQSRERYILLVVDDYTRYTMVFSLCSKGEVVDVLIPWICAVRLQLRKRFRQDLPVMRQHSDKGGEFSSDLLRDFCRGEGILQSFTVPYSPQQNGIAECRIGLVMEVARTSMIHAVAPHILWHFAVRYATHQLNLWPRVSLPETSPTLRWTGKVSDASVFRVWGSPAFVRDTSADKLSAHAIPCVVTFDESVSFYRLFPYRSAPPPSLPLFLALGPPPVDPLPPQGPAPSGVSQVDPLPGTAPVEVVVGSGAMSREVASEGVEPGGAVSKGVGSGGAEPGGEEPGGADPAGVEPGGAEPEGVEPGGAESEGADSCVSGLFGEHAFGAGGAGDAGAGGAGAAETSGVGGAGAGDPTEPEAAGAGGSGAGGAGAKVGGTSAGGAGAGGAGAFDPGGTVWTRPYFVPLLLALLHPSCVHRLTKRRELASRPASPLCTARRFPRSRPPLVPRMHVMALRPSSVPKRVPLLAPPESSLPEVPDRESVRTRAASSTVSCLLATAISDPSFESAAASALVAELPDFPSACHLDYATALVAESESASPPSIRGECALGTDVLECLADAVPRFASMLLAPEEDPDAPDIPTPRSYIEAITGPYSSQWQAAMDAEMASCKSTCTYVDEVTPPGANIVDGMWIFRVKRPPGSPPAVKARYVARGFSQRQGVNYFHTFSPTPKLTTLRVLLHVAAQRDYELHSLDYSTAFLQGSLHEEIWLRRPPGFTGLFPASTQWSLRRPVYGLRYTPREWHDTLRTTLVALGFAPSTADPSLFLRTDTSLPPFYVFVYVDDLVFAKPDTEALTLVKSELRRRHTCTDLGELRSYLGL
ncbi:unnamed protein product [Closterium sp. NIES-53]